MKIPKKKTLEAKTFDRCGAPVFKANVLRWYERPDRLQLIAVKDYRVGDPERLS